MKGKFVFTKELAKQLDTHDKMAYAIKYGLGLATRSEDPEYRRIADAVDKANRPTQIVTADQLKEIIGHLNERCGSCFKANAKESIRHINARFAEGYTVEDFFAVIDSQAEEWTGTSQEQYLRPMTLFGTKFAAYLNYARHKARRDADMGGSFDTDSFYNMAMERAYGGYNEAN